MVHTIRHRPPSQATRATLDAAFARGYIRTSNVRDANLWWRICKLYRRTFVWVNARASWLMVDFDTTYLYLTEDGLDRLLDIVRPAHPRHRGCGCGWGLGLLGARVEREAAHAVASEILEFSQVPGMLSTHWELEAGSAWRRQLRTAPELMAAAVVTQ